MMNKLLLFLMLISMNTFATTSINSAITAEGRPADDLKADKARKPEQVLKFAGIKPGMHILDFFSGGGYYAELASHLVGPEGKVTAFNNEAYVKFSKNGLSKRKENGRLNNIVELIQDVNEVELGQAQFDMMLLMLSYHDLYHVNEKSGWPKIEAQKLLKKIYLSIKPGGTVIIVDHAAQTGAPKEVGDSLHRIDPALVKQQLAEIGFSYTAESNALRNPKDPLDVPMWEKGIRGKTDRFIFKFTKAE